MAARIDPTADASENAAIGDGTSIWHQAQVREATRIGAGCIIGKGVYIDAGVTLGDHVKTIHKQTNVNEFIAQG